MAQLIWTYSLLLVLIVRFAVKTIGAEAENESLINPRKLRPITSLHKYIVNGVNSDIGRYPYQVVLIRDDDGDFYCGGSLIAPDIVLTAAHCTVPRYVGVGRHDRNTYERDYKVHEVLYSYRHPDHVKETFEFDLQLLKLKKVSIQHLVRLNDDPNVPSLIQGSKQSTVTVLGFGKTHFNGFSSTALREVDLDMISNDACAQSKDPFSSWIDFQIGYEDMIFDDMFCLDDRSGIGKDACTGDSGGPAILKGNSVQEDVQVGVVSWGFGCGLPNFPGVYARISHEITWLRSSVCTISEQPQSDFQCDRFTGVPAGTSENEFMIDITISIEFALYPDRISWAFSDATTRETIIYQPSSGYAMITPRSYHEQVVSLPAGSNITFSIWSSGHNGLETFSATYLDHTDNYEEITIMEGVGGGTVKSDSATSVPFVLPSAPTNSPTGSPTKSPTRSPTKSPTGAPTKSPTGAPTKSPTGAPTKSPTGAPTNSPTGAPTPEVLRRDAPLESPSPTFELTSVTSGTLTGGRTDEGTMVLTEIPTFGQTSGTTSSMPSLGTTDNPSNYPTNNPTASQLPSTSADPTAVASEIPTRVPTVNPSNTPTETPTRGPSSEPSGSPSARPTESPSKEPSAMPSLDPSSEPSGSGSPSRTATEYPSKLPTTLPDSLLNASDAPSSVGSADATDIRERKGLTEAPGATPSDLNATTEPPSETETNSEFPSGNSSEFPTAVPSIAPSEKPSLPPNSTTPSASPTQTAKTASVPLTPADDTTPTVLTSTGLEDEFRLFLPDTSFPTDSGTYNKSSFPSDSDMPSSEDAALEENMQLTSAGVSLKLLATWTTIAATTIFQSEDYLPC